MCLVRRSLVYLDSWIRHSFILIKNQSLEVIKGHRSVFAGWIWSDLFYQVVDQDGRVVKALDLSSNGGIPAWVRTSLLVNFFSFSILPAAHQWFQPIRDENRDREGKNAQYELNSNFKERLAKIMKTWHRFKKMGRLKIRLGLGHKIFFQ